MSQEKMISDELINAFVDNQLSLEDKEQLYSQISNDQELTRQVCEIRKIRDMLQLAYREIPEAPSTAVVATVKGNRNWRNLAASVVLAIGIVVGWQFTNIDGQGPTKLASTTAESNQAKVLFHLHSDDPKKVQEALIDVESLMKYYRQTGLKARVELVANGDGINLLRTDTTRYADKIHQLQREYPNLAFVACQNTINRLKQEKGVSADLLPGTVVIDSGVAQIMRRQQQGWAYIQV